MGDLRPMNLSSFRSQRAAQKPCAETPSGERGPRERKGVGASGDARQRLAYSANPLDFRPRLRVVTDALDTIGEQCDRVWPTPIASRWTNDHLLDAEFASYDRDDAA